MGIHNAQMAPGAGFGFIILISTMFWLPNMCVSEIPTEATETRVSEKLDITHFTLIAEDGFSDTRGYDEPPVAADGNPCFYVYHDTVFVKTDCNKSVIEAGAFSTFSNKERFVRINQYGFIWIFSVGWYLCNHRR